MSEERKKILEMLADGKITVDDAERLLIAVGDRGAGGPRSAGAVDDEGDDPADRGPDLDAADLERRIRAGLDVAHRTVRASMPRLRAVIRDNAPNVERIVGEATAAIPGIVEEMTRAIHGAFDEARDRGDESFSARTERDLSVQAPLAPGSRLILHNPRGRVEVATWEEERVQADIHVTVRARDEETARRCAEAVQVVPEPEDGRLVLRPAYPEGRQEASYQFDIRLRLPRRLHLDLHTAHGDLVVSEMEGDLVLGGEHGDLRLAGTSGAAAVQHSHGGVHVGRVAGAFALNAHHSSLHLDEAVGEASLNAHHGRLQLRRVGGNAVINAHHAPLEIDEIHGNAVANNHHAPVQVRQVLGDLALNTHHSPVQIGQVGGSLRLANDFGPVAIERIGGELSAQSSHAPLDVGAVGRSAVVRSTHGPVDLGPVGGEVTVESDRGNVRIGGAGGRVAVRASRCDVRIEHPAGEVLAENARGAIAVLPAGPVRSSYTLSNNRGNVRVVLPEGSSVAVQAFVRRGHVDTDLPLDVSANGQQGQSVSGALGAGGPSVQIEVDGGDLSLRRAD